jgi:hypothetical protein
MSDCNQSLLVGVSGLALVPIKHVQAEMQTYTLIAASPLAPTC